MTSEGNSINDGDTVDIVEGEDFNFTCSTTDLSVDVTLTADIDIPDSPIASSRDLDLINVQRNLTGTEFTCTDDTVFITFTLNVLC